MTLNYKNSLLAMGLFLFAALVILTSFATLFISQANADTVCSSGVCINLKVNGSESPVTVTAGTLVTLSWTSSGATKCSAGPPQYGNWDFTDGYNKPVNSLSWTVGPINTSGSLMIICVDAGGSGAAHSSTINIAAPSVPPTITSAINNGPVTEGSNITFDVDWNDANAEGIKMFICKTNSINTGTPACSSGTWCSDSNDFDFTDPINCAYTTQSGDVGPNSYWAFVCDDEIFCSSSTAGSFSVDAQTLSVALTVTSPSGPNPHSTTLSGNVSGNATGTINYNFWWNCTNATTSVATATTACGTLPAPAAGSCASNANGYKCEAVLTDPQLTLSNSYTPAGSYTAKVIVERGAAPSAQDQSSVTVVNNPPNLNSVTDDSPVTEGTNVTFNAYWDDPNGDSVYGIICKTNAITPGTPPSCPGGQWTPASGLEGASPIPFTYPTGVPDIGSNDYYAFVCDSPAGECSSPGVMGSWTQETVNAQWEARLRHTSVVFNNQMWVLGGDPDNAVAGCPDTDHCNDVWYSTDGKDWTRVTAAAQWEARNNHTSFVFNNQMWVLGGRPDKLVMGCPDSLACNDVWYSTDGKDWTQATISANWEARSSHTSLVFNNQMWVLGGYPDIPVAGCPDAAVDLCNDVWYSTDGIDWTRATVNAQWDRRYNHTSVVFNSQMWILGGYDDAGGGAGCVSGFRCNDVWYSTDGQDWTRATTNAQWEARRAHTSFVFNNQMWVLGGNPNDGPAGCSDFVHCNDVWYSTDGATWTRATVNANWKGRLEHTSLIFNNQIWVMGGEPEFLDGIGCPDDFRCNDVWSSDISNYGIFEVEVIPTLSVSLVAAPATGLQPLPVTLTATVSGTASGTINYSFWWHCTDATTSVAAAIASCGDPTDPDIGAKYDGELPTFKDALHTYENDGPYTAKVIVERNGAPAAQEQTPVTVIARTLSVALTATPSSGDQPLTTTLSAAVSGTAVGTIDYFFWWDCDDTTTDGGTAILACGDPTDAAIGAQFFNVVSASQDAPAHTYTNGSYTAKVITERGLAPFAEDRVAVTSFGPADLIAEDLSISGELFEGASITFGGTIKNRGAIAAGTTSNARFRLDINNDGSWNATLGTPLTSNLAAGASEIETSNPWTTVGGTHRFELCGDYLNVVLEDDTANNCTTQTFTVLGLPDLISENLMTSGTLLEGNSLTFIGDITNQGFTLAGGFNWTQATAAAQWPAREGHSSVNFAGELWMIGGFGGGSSRNNDVWRSTDGIIWTRATVAAQWKARDKHTSVVFNSQMWVIGGFDGSRSNDVWRSTDGVTWTRATFHAQWKARNGHTSVVFNSQMWVMGGHVGGARDNDVWRSTDGVTWTRATASAAWQDRFSHTSVIFNPADGTESGRMWVMGGFGSRLNDVWSSADGITWVQEAAQAQWGARVGHTSAVFDGKIWVLGGSGGGSGRLSDTWWSTDGISWERAASDAGWAGRRNHSSAVFDTKLWVMGGFPGPRINDVWFFDFGQSSNARFRLDLDNNGSWDTILGTPPTGLLLPGASETETSDPWVAQLGTHRFELCADTPANVIPESNELNNCLTSALFTVDPQTLSVTLSATPSSSPTAPLDTTLSADVAGTAFGTINYTFWWDCANSSTSVANVSDPLHADFCGDPTDPAFGARFPAVTTDPQAVAHTYSTFGLYTAKVIAERGLAPPDESRMVVFVAMSGPAKVGEVRIQGLSGIIILPLFITTDPNLTNSALRIQTAAGPRAFDLVLPSDPDASPVRIQTGSGVRAIFLESTAPTGWIWLGNGNSTYASTTTWAQIGAAVPAGAEQLAFGIWAGESEDFDISGNQTNYTMAFNNPTCTRSDSPWTSVVEGECIVLYDLNSDAFFDNNYFDSIISECEFRYTAATRLVEFQDVSTSEDCAFALFYNFASDYQPVPTVTTNAATAVTETSATLQGSANPNGANTRGYFRWSAIDPGICNDTFGTRTPSINGSALGSGTTDVSISPRSISGLTASTTYHFCALAKNEGGTGFGNTRQFTTGDPSVTCYTDADGDGYGIGAAQSCASLPLAGFADNNNDCCDSDANAKPGQTSYFTSSRSGCGGYDYDCGGTVTYLYNYAGSCAGTIGDTRFEVSCSGSTIYCGDICPIQRYDGEDEEEDVCSPLGSVTQACR